jgi:hypothetical protein
MQGDDTIKAEDSQDSKVDKKIKSICKGCWKHIAARSERLSPVSKEKPTDDPRQQTDWKSHKESLTT